MKRFSFTVGLCLAIAGPLSTLAPDAMAASCRDAKGKFVTCPKPAKQSCRDGKGKFVSCSAATTAPG